MKKINANIQSKKYLIYLLHHIYYIICKIWLNLYKHLLSLFFFKEGILKKLGNKYTPKGVIIEDTKLDKTSLRR